MSDIGRKPEPRCRSRRIPLCVLFALAGTAILLGLSTLLQDEEIARFRVGRGITITVLAEPTFHYEPPGFVSCRVTAGDEVIIGRRRFLSVGPERVSSGRFAALSSGDGDLIALILDSDLQFALDLRTGRAWPGFYAVVDDLNAAFAIEVLSRFASEGRALR